MLLEYRPLRCIRFSNRLYSEQPVFVHQALQLGIHLALHHHRYLPYDSSRSVMEHHSLDTENQKAFQAHEHVCLVVLALVVVVQGGEVLVV